jgi:hypothetical protein
MGLNMDFWFLLIYKSPHLDHDAPINQQSDCTISNITVVQRWEMIAITGFISDGCRGGVVHLSHQHSTWSHGCPTFGFDISKHHLSLFGIVASVEMGRLEVSL